MTKIALAAAAILIATGTAFAGSGNSGSNNAQPAAPVASTGNPITTSIQKSDATVQKPVTSGSNRDLFGNR
jgi:hypothetical protein